MSFQVSGPSNRAHAKQALLDLQVAIAEHVQEMQARDEVDAERRVFGTWKALLRAKEQLEREREAPIKYHGVEVNERRITFSASLGPLDDVVDDGRFRQVPLLDGGYLGGEVYDVREGEPAWRCAMAIRRAFPWKASFALTRQGSIHIGGPSPRRP